MWYNTAPSKSRIRGSDRHPAKKITWRKTVVFVCFGVQGAKKDDCPEVSLFSLMLSPSLSLSLYMTISTYIWWRGEQNSLGKKVAWLHFLFALPLPNKAWLTGDPAINDFTPPCALWQLLLLLCANKWESTRAQQPTLKDCRAKHTKWVVAPKWLFLSKTGLQIVLKMTHGHGLIAIFLSASYELH